MVLPQDHVPEDEALYDTVLLSKTFRRSNARMNAAMIETKLISKRKTAFPTPVTLHVRSDVFQEFDSLTMANRASQLTLKRSTT